MSPFADIAFYFAHFAIDHGDYGMIGDIFAFKAMGVYLTAGFKFFFVFQGISLRCLIVHTKGASVNGHVIDFVGKAFGSNFGEEIENGLRLALLHVEMGKSHIII